MNKLTQTPIDTMPHQPKQVLVEHPHVIIDPTILGGSPHVRGTRVPVRRLWVWHHKGGISVETLMKRYPNLGPARVLDALAFAFDNQDLMEADLARESLAVVSGG
jgi:uncharacterized protein (DUF433 family)